MACNNNLSVKDVPNKVLRRNLNEVAVSSNNFNNRNDRNGDAVVGPTIATDGTAVDDVINTDGSADISLEWSWGGTEADIDGFIIYHRASTTDNASYVMGTTPAQETTYIVRADKRAFIFYGVGADSFHTFGVQAYRVVDPDINSNQIIKGSIVQPSRAEEDPYQPTTTPSFAGSITGTIGSASDAAATATSSDFTAITGSTKPEDNADVTGDHSADVDALQTQNAPAEAGANKLNNMSNNLATTTSVADRAITTPESVYTAGTINVGQNATVTVASVTITTIGQVVEINSAMQIAGTDPTGDDIASFRLLRDSTVIYDDITVVVTTTDLFHAAPSISDNPNAGTYTYKIDVETQSGNSVDVDRRYLKATELMR